MEVLEDYEKKGSDKLILGHSCHIYRDGKDYFTILTHFIFESLRNNKCCILIVDDEAKQEILVNLKKFINVQKCLDEDKIIFVSYKIAFYQENNFSINKIINLLNTRLNIAISQDFKGISVCGEMTWIVEDHDALEKFSDLYTALNDFCLMNNSNFLDQMDKRLLDVDTFFNMLNLHSSVIIGLQHYKKHNANYQDSVSFTDLEKVPTPIKQIQKNGSVLEQNSILSDIEESNSSTGEHSIEYLEDLNQEFSEILDEKLKNFDYDLLWNIFSQSDIPTLVLSKEGRILDYNHAMVNLTGYSHEEVPNIQEWFPKIYPNEVYRNVVIQISYKSRNRQVGVVKNIFDITTKNGEIRNVEFSVYDIIHLGKPSDIQIVQGIDITERKRSKKALRKATRKYKFLLDNLQEGVILEDSFGYITYVNPKGAKMLEFNQEKMIGKHWRTFVFEKDLAIVEEESFKRMLGISSSYETILRTKNDEKIPVIITAAPIFEENERFSGVLSVITDISILKSAERERSKFITMTSHELRTPLTSIKGYFEFLHKYWKELEEKNVESSFETIFKNITRLERLIAGVININMIEREKFIMNMSDFYLCELIDSIQEFYNLKYNESIKFKHNKLEMDTIVYGDQDRLHGVIDNLLDNAIRHTEEKTRKINVVSEILPDLIRIRISDNGAGIDPKNIDRIFEQFVSIPTKYSITGTGIGLFTSRKTIEAHGGSLAAKSEGVDLGATFLIELPRRHHPSNL